MGLLAEISDTDIKPHRCTPTREHLPDERQSITHHFVIHASADGRPVDYHGYVIVGLYADGRPGELFVKMDQQGSTVSGFVDAWAIGVSMLLQLGVGLDAVCAKFRAVRFEPSGPTGSADMPFALSPIDYVARWLERKFLPAAGADR